ncbi:MAG: hypothetical protein R3C01_06915 [Planctomycetaceae bacterium]
MSTPSNNSGSAFPTENEESLLPGERVAAASEVPCPDCGEKVRAGLVRCWNCGCFLREDIANKFQKMQQAPQQVIFSELSQTEALPLGTEEDGGFQLRVVEATPARTLPQSEVYGLTSSEDADDDDGDAEASADAPGTAEAKGGSAPSETKKKGNPPPDTAVGGVAHSVATGGDVLLEVALSEQAEDRKRRKKRGVSMKGGARTPGGFVIFCPYGCQIEVRDQHRGMTGQCPKCRAPFIVPTNPPDYGHKERQVEEAAVAASTSPTGEWTPWLIDVHVHDVNPEKLKLKAGSLVKEFAEMDLAFGPQGLLLMTLAKKSGGLFGGGGDKNRPETRALVQAHFKDGKGVSESPAAESRQYSIAELSQLRVVQPTATPGDSMFAGIPVFGEYQIAVQMPFSEGQHPRYLSFGLTGFREFTAALNAIVPEVMLVAHGAPTEDKFVTSKCHYTDVEIQAVENLPWYQADAKSGVVLAGWRCAACGLTISEDGRKKENLGGKAGKGIAKAKCPKCTNKFGEQPLYTLPSHLATPALAGEGAST